MAQTPTILSDLNDLAKDYYTEVYQPQENTATALKAQVSGLVRAVHVRENSSAGSGSASFAPGP